MHAKVKQSEAQLLSFQQKYQTAQNKLGCEQEQQERESKEQERKVQQEILSLQKQISQKLTQHEEQQSSIEAIQAEVTQLESVLQDKKKKTADLETDLKEANLGAFVQAPSGWKASGARGRYLVNLTSLSAFPNL